VKTSAHHTVIAPCMALARQWTLVQLISQIRGERAFMRYAHCLHRITFASKNGND